MNIRHLSDDELDHWLTDESLSTELALHATSCVVCRRRRDAFLAAVEELQGAEPGEAVRERVRQAALDAWSGRPARIWGRWALAAAAVLLLAVLPFARSHHTQAVQLNPDSVLAEVDQVLDRDPLSAVAPADLVEEITPDGQSTPERSLT
jgi:hypothetical protein